MPETEVLTARDRIVAMTLHGASLAQEITSQRELDQVRQQVMARLANLVVDLRSACVREHPSALGLCAGDMAVHSHTAGLSGRGRGLLEDAALAERLYVQFLLAKLQVPMPGPLLVKMHAMALAA